MSTTAITVPTSQEIILDTTTQTELLRPQQVVDMNDEKSRLERSLHNPHIQDKGEVQRALRRISKQLDEQTPKPFTGTEVDRAAHREAELRALILTGMCSQEEMRKSPPGAVGKHMQWEKANKARLKEWKALRLRLNVGTTDPDIANFERYRPKDSTLSMDNPLVSGKQHFMPEVNGPAVIFTDSELAFLRETSPELAAKLALLNNAQRSEVKELTEVGLNLAAPKKSKPKKAKPAVTAPSE